MFEVTGLEDQNIDPPRRLEQFWFAVTVTEVMSAVGVWLLLGAPVIVTTAAFLDAARRPEWAWVMSDRSRILWLGMLVGGTITYFPGPAIAAVYWFTARRDVSSIERGDLEGLK